MVRLASCLYALLMRLYQRGFRSRFGAEMRGVFEGVVEGAAERGLASLVGVCARELWDLVRVPFDEHRYQHRKKETEQMTKRVDLSTGWTLWLHWVLASVVGACLGAGAGALAVLVVAKVVGGRAEDRVPTEILLGAGLGIVQWLVLRRRVSRAKRWVWASIAGAVVFSVLDRPLVLAIYSISDSILQIRALVDAVALGAFLGFAQWLVLRHHTSRSGWWLVACMGGYGIATLAAGDSVSGLGEVIAYLVVPPAITGLALVWILGHPRLETLGPAQRVQRTVDRQSGDTTETQASWGAAVAAALPLAGYALSALMTETARNLWHADHFGGLFRILWTNVIRIAPLPVVFYLPLLGGLVVAWTKGFPRWSYPYLGWLMVVLLACLSMGGLDAPYLWLTWGPWLLATLVAVTLARSLAPLKRLWRSVRQDWTQASFALIALLEFLVLASFDEMPGPRGWRVFWESLSTAALVLGALWYMRASRRGGRIAALLGSATLSVLLSTGSIAYFWHSYPKPHIQPPLNGYRMFAQGLAFLTVVVVLLLVPAALSTTLKRLLPNRAA